MDFYAVNGDLCSICILSRLRAFKSLFSAPHGLLTVCGYGCIIALYSYVRLCFICVPCKLVHFVRLCA
nr:MAG TPA_asm: hypothetical protein [Caudoviricetes sp.]DAZ57793.1 MAG TPA: hypothetical protein [Caudoviricetes sp.]